MGRLWSREGAGGKEREGEGRKIEAREHTTFFSGHNGFFLFVFNQKLSLSCLSHVVPVRVTDQKQCGEERVYSAQTSTLQSVTEESQDKNSSRARADAGAVEGGSVLPLSSCLAQPAFLYDPGFPAQNGPTYNRLVSPPSITK